MTGKNALKLYRYNNDPNLLNIIAEDLEVLEILKKYLEHTHLINDLYKIDMKPLWSDLPGYKEVLEWMKKNKLDEQ